MSSFGNEASPPKASIVGRSARNALLYGLGTAGSQGIVVLLLSLFARWLPPRAYASYGLVTTLAVLAGSVLSLGVVPAYFRFASRRPESVAANAVLCVTTTAAVGAVAVIPLNAWIGPLVFGTYSNRYVFILMVVDFFIESSILVPVTRARAEEAPLRYLCIIGMRHVTTLVAAVVLVGIFGRGLEGAMEALVLGAGAGLVLGLVLSPVSLRASDLGLLRRMIRFGLPLQPAFVFNWALTYVDRYMLSAMASLVALAPYTAVSSLVNGANGLLTSTFSLLWPPLMYRISEMPAGREILGRLGTAFIAVFLWVNLALALNAETLLRVYSPRYVAASYYLPVLALAYVAYCPFVFTNTAFQLADRTRRVPALVLTGALINVGANLILIPSFAGAGAALASVIGYGTMAVVSVVVAQRTYRIEYDYARLAKLTVLAGTCIAVNAWTRSPWVGLALTVAAAFIVAPAVVGPLRKARALSAGKA